MSNAQTIATLDSKPQTGLAAIAQQIVLVAATVAAGLYAGFFWAYQVTVIPGLKEVDDTTYVSTFQAINDKVQNPWFFSVFIGAPVLIGAALTLHRRSARPLVALMGAALFFNLVTFAVTAAGNVPLNNDFADYKNITPEVAATARSDFEDTWNFLNMVRTLAALASLVCLTVAIISVGDRAATNGERTNVHPGRGV